MTRDYAKKAPPKPKPKAPMPPWLWMVTGLLIGLFVAFLVYINNYNSPAPKRETEAPASTPAPKPRPAPITKEAARPKKAPEPAPAKKDDKVRFDFYKILPEYEVVIPEEDLKKPELKEAPPGKYLIQAGSFSTAEDADTRRAQLALLGLVSRVQTVSIDDKNTRHRVQLGPYEDLNKLDTTRKLLQGSGIEFLLLRAKD